MFTGIVEQLAEVQAITHKRNLSVLKVRIPKTLKGIQNGESICVNGVCLTVAQKNGQLLSFDIVRETLSRTGLLHLKSKQKVNLERALRTNGRLDGHFVTGHIDAVGLIKKKETASNYVAYTISRPKAIARYIVEKGSISVEGVSLTVGKVTKDSFIVHLIPYTLKVTTLGQKKKGDAVNLEADILARYTLGSRWERPD